MLMTSSSQIVRSKDGEAAQNFSWQNFWFLQETKETEMAKGWEVTGSSEETGVCETWVWEAENMAGTK